LLPPDASSIIYRPARVEFIMMQVRAQASPGWPVPNNKTPTGKPKEALEDRVVDLQRSCLCEFSGSSRLVIISGHCMLSRRRKYTNAVTTQPFTLTAPSSARS
jgi:hypothetical protein